MNYKIFILLLLFTFSCTNQNLSQKKIAIAVNGSIIPKKEYQKIILKEGDKIEIVQAVGGGN